MASRKSERLKAQESFSPMIEALSTGRDQEGFYCQYISKYIGCGVFASKSFFTGDFLLEYKGEIISYQEGMKREKEYPLNKGSFLYFFSFHGKRLCMDATEDPFHVNHARFINDEHKSPNSVMKVKTLFGRPHLCVFALKDIQKHEEIRYDYGVADLPWRLECKTKSNMSEWNKCDLEELTFCGLRKVNSLIQSKRSTRIQDDEKLPERDDEILTDGIQDVEKLPEGDEEILTDGMQDVEKLPERDEEILMEGIQDVEKLPERDEEILTDGIQDVEKLPEGDEEILTDGMQDVEKLPERDEEILMEGIQDDEKLPERDDEILTDGIQDVEKLPEGDEEILTDGMQDVEKLPERDEEILMEGIQDVEKLPERDEEILTDGIQDVEKLPEGDEEILTDGMQDVEKLPERDEEILMEGIQDVEKLPERDEEILTDGIQDVEKLPEGDEEILTDGMQDVEKLPERDEEILMEGIQNVEKSPERDQEILTDGIQDVEKLPEGDEEILTDGMQDVEKLPERDEEILMEGIQDVEKLPERDEEILTDGIQDVEKLPEGDEEILTDGMQDVEKLPERDEEILMEGIQNVEKSPERDQEILTDGVQDVEKLPERDEEILTDEDMVNQTSDEDDAMSTEFPLLQGSCIENKTDSFPEVKKSSEKRKLKKKPDRYCVFCQEAVCGGHLKRHIIRNHKAEEEVKLALSKPKNEQNIFFDRKRLEGIYQYNLNLMSKTSESKPIDNQLMRERKPKFSDELRMCTGCNRFLSNRNFYKHRIKCSNVNPSPRKLCVILCQDVHKDKEFVEKILNRFRDSDAGNLCRVNQLIQQVGYRHFSLRRCEASKIDEIRKCVMTEMRELARLFLYFKSQTQDVVTVEDMFTRKYLSLLRESIQDLGQKEDGKGEKHGLVLSFNAIILRTIKSLKGFYTETSQDMKFEEICKFHQAYMFRAHEICANARYQSVSNSLDKARRPAELPDNQEINTLKEYLALHIDKMTKNFRQEDYAWLRSLVVCRLTLFNGRRGEEPSRILLTEFQDAVDGIWLQDSDIEFVEDSAEKYLIGQFKLAYLHGKGRKYVPVLIPPELMSSINLLIQNRAKHGIRDDNPFVFATKHSNSHCSGWHAVKLVAQKAGVCINATKNRHRISTIYAGLHMSENDKAIFLSHMGHEESINKENYQCPPGVRELMVMGKLLGNIDKGETSTQGECGEDVNGLAISTQASGTCKTPNQGDQSHSDSEVDTEDEEGEEDVDENPKRQKSTRWSAAATDELRMYFVDFFRNSCSKNQHSNAGRLPSKKEILAYLSTSKASSECLKHLSKTDAYKKTRAKLFNERKTMRLNMSKNMKKFLN